jgi:hypothetical protein
MKQIRSLPLIVSAGLLADPLVAGELERLTNIDGPSIHSDQYGRPWRSAPGKELDRDTYEPGVHSNRHSHLVKQYPPQPGQPYGELK